jgi:ribonuclease E
MLDTERYDKESADKEPGHGDSADVTDTHPGTGDEGGDTRENAAEGEGRGRRLFRRARRAATRPPGPPEPQDEPAASSAAQSQVTQPPQVPRGFQATRAPQLPAHSQPAAQAPLVIFQPPDMASAERRSAPVSVPPAESGEPAPAAPAGDVSDDNGPEGAASPGKRRRRGGRGHSRSRGTGDEGTEQGAEAAAGVAEDTDGQPDDGAEHASESAGENGAADDGDGSAPAKRRRRRRRSGSAAEGDAPASDDPPNTVVHVRAARTAAADDKTDVKGVKGSTRLEAKRQRRREGRESGRRRPPIITESEFLARREAVERVMVVRQKGDRTQIAVLEDGVLVEHYVDRASHQSYVGNVYLGRVQNVLPSMEAAFVDVGKGRNAVLYAGEVNFDASGLEGESKRIESALKSGQSVVVQVTKDPIGHKGARLTSQVSLPGRYLVYVPGASMTGISRKLPDTERARLKQILKQVMPEDAGVIVRTAAEGATEEELSRDVARLTAQWEAIERKAKSATAPELLYGEPDLTIRVVRDIFNEDFTKLVIASDGEWDMVGEYVRYVAPGLADRLERWAGDQDAFAAYRIDEQIAKALERTVWLPSGGSLVIDATEAMTVIDVNTGKFTGQGGNLEQTVTRNNLEAAEEIVRQLRLRDVGGIIVIDFIDMVLESNRDLVLRRLLECLARDRTKHQVAEVTSLGLVQMTRKRVGSGLLEAFSVPCEHCNGRGVIITMDAADHAPHADRNAARASAAKAIATVAASSGGAADQTAADGASASEPAEAAAVPGVVNDDGGEAADAGGRAGGRSSGAGGRRRRRGGGQGASAASGDAPSSNGAPHGDGTADGIAQGASEPDAQQQNGIGQDRPQEAQQAAG